MCVFVYNSYLFLDIYVLMIKLVAMATILEGDVLQANYLGWPHAAMCGPIHVVFEFSNPS